MVVEPPVHAVHQEGRGAFPGDNLAPDGPDVYQGVAGVGIDGAVELDGVALQQLIVLPVGGHSDVGRIVDLQPENREESAILV